MPKVGKGKGSRHFAYNEAGMVAARDESAKTGKPVEYSGDMKKAGKKPKKGKK